jgi:hypothetical protein
MLILLSDARDHGETVYGCRVPSRKHTGIPHSDIRPGRITKDGLTILNFAERVDWEGLAVTRTHLRRCIKRRKKVLSATDPEK